MLAGRELLLRTPWRPGARHDRRPQPARRDRSRHRTTGHTGSGPAQPTSSPSTRPPPGRRARALAWPKSG